MMTWQSCYVWTALNGFAAVGAGVTSGTYALLSQPVLAAAWAFTFVVLLASVGYNVATLRKIRRSGGYRDRH